MSDAPKGFLQAVAETYYANERDNLDRYCFVFPNKRSATHFMQKLQDVAIPPMVLPGCTTISELVADQSDYVEASRLERMFILYNEYNKLMTDPVDFDRFVYWGDMLLNDFDDVDRYLVDADALFVNLKRFREIRSNYLTPEQIDVISRYWNGTEDLAKDIENFWQHTVPAMREESDDTDSSSAASHFVKLWMVLDKLYHAYHRTLNERGLTAPGRLYRDAVTALQERDDWDWDRYVFVGFNVLSASEIKIFKTLQTRGRADFYWDLPSPQFQGLIHHRDGTTSHSNKAMHFIRRNIKAFPSLYDITPLIYDGRTLPKIDIVNVPSRIGQAKVAGNIVAKLSESGKLDPANAINTALVMPDESMFVSVVNSMPADLGAINVTMGYPLRRTPVATFLKAVTSLHLRARKSGGEWYYFYEDLYDVVTHSLIGLLDSEAAHALVKDVEKQHRFMVPVSLIADNYPTIAPLFTPISHPDDLNEVGAYITRVVTSLREGLYRLPSSHERAIQLQFLQAYLIALRQLTDTASRHSISMGEGTAFRLIERSLSGETVNMKGEPLRGLQLMGVLETRALDFDNVIMMSMNERVFPKKSYSKSFIPDALRHAYHMSTIEHQESIFAYYFYRLISRASQVTLLYDGRNVGMNRSEMSRYIVQLLYNSNPDIRVRHIGAAFQARIYEPLPVTVTKDSRIISKLAEFLTPDSGRVLSASSINTYIDCPLQFYLRFVEKYDAYEPSTDYMDASTYGQIVHWVFEHLYLTLSASGTYPVTVNASDIRRLINPDDPTIFSLVHRAIDSMYLNLADDSSSILVGETKAICTLVSEIVRETLRCELEFAPFTVTGAEVKLQGNYELAPGLHVNIRQIVDRVDRVNGVMRVVDYKTGSDVTRIKDWDAPFDAESNNRPKAMVQLMLYCKILAASLRTDEPITPVIYNLRKIYVNGINKLTCNKQEITDYHTELEEFDRRFASVISDIFNPELPFMQSPDVGGHACTFCQFKSICGVPEDNSEK